MLYIRTIVIFGVMSHGEIFAKLFADNSMSRLGSLDFGELTKLAIIF